MGPIVSSEHARSAELHVSLLERLFERPVYANFHPQGPQLYPDGVNGYASPFSPLTNLVRVCDLLVFFSAFLLLIWFQNYRSHPVILMPPSAIFYKDSLEPFAENGDISWSRLPSKYFPLLFMGHDSKEKSDDEVRPAQAVLPVIRDNVLTRVAFVQQRASWFNTGDVGLVVEAIESLLSEGAQSTPPLQADQIGVMAPWRAQVWKIREALRDKSLNKVDVGTVEVRLSARL